LRQLIAAEYLSLDGRMEDPGPAGDYEHRGWTMPYWNDELMTYQSELLFGSDALLLGRVTYEEFVAAEAVRMLKQQAGKSILICGSSELVNALMQHGLIDVYRLMVYPLTLGTGRRFFTDGGDKISLRLTDAKPTSTGVVVLTYEGSNVGSIRSHPGER
jgi:dihydrofolate reductase